MQDIRNINNSYDLSEIHAMLEEEEKLEKDLEEITTGCGIKGKDHLAAKTPAPTPYNIGVAGAAGLSAAVSHFREVAERFTAAAGISEASFKLNEVATNMKAWLETSMIELQALGVSKPVARELMIELLPVPEPQQTFEEIKRALMAGTLDVKTGYVKLAEVVRAAKPDKPKTVRRSPNRRERRDAAKHGKRKK